MRASAASWNGTAPIDASSGDQIHHRLSRAGNRRINRVLHWVAVAAGLTAVVNGTLLGAESGWGFLAAVAWVFAGGVTLAARGTNSVTVPTMATATG